MENRQQIRVVLDTSIILSWYFNVSHRQIALEIRDKITSGEILVMIPDIVLYELEAIFKKCPFFDQEMRELALKSLQGMGIDILPTSVPCIERSLEYAFSYNIPNFVAYFLAIAEYHHAAYWTLDSQSYKNINDLKFVRLFS